jgi:hypothetical protein
MPSFCVPRPVALVGRIAYDGLSSVRARKGPKDSVVGLSGSVGVSQELILGGSVLPPILDRGAWQRSEVHVRQD